MYMLIACIFVAFIIIELDHAIDHTEVDAHITQCDWSEWREHLLQKIGIMSSTGKLKGELHSKLQNYQHFFRKNNNKQTNKQWLSWSKLSEKLKNGIEILVGQAVKVIDQNMQNNVLINKSRMARPTKILMPLKKKEKKKKLNDYLAEKCLRNFKDSQTICFKVIIIFPKTRRFLNHESRLLSRSHIFAIIVMLDLNPYLQKLERSLTPRWPLTPSLLRSHVTLPKDHCNSVPWKYIKVCGYSDLFSPKTWTKGHWPLDDLWPHICWGPMCDSTQGSL